MQNINYKLMLKLDEINNILNSNCITIYKTKQLLDTGFEIVNYLRAEYKSINLTDKYYIWRTRKDDKVRASHAANNGKIFSIDNPPPTGHPGQDYGCRCWAEPVIWRYATQELMTKIDDNKKKWDYLEFLWHARFGDGKEITLSQIGHLKDIINHAEHSLGVYDKINEQIMNKARKINKVGFLHYDTSQSYDFKPVHYVHGYSTLKSDFKGFVERNGNYLVISVGQNHRLLIKKKN